MAAIGIRLLLEKCNGSAGLEVTVSIYSSPRQKACRCRTVRLTGEIRGCGD